MKRIVIPLLVAIAVAIGGPTLAALVVYRGDPDTIIPILLYWPLFITDKLGLGQNCGNADLISDKLTCIRTALYIDAVLYPVVICVCAYITHRILVRRDASSNL